jgi:hypothetical protein
VLPLSSRGALGVVEWALEPIAAQATSADSIGNKTGLRPFIARRKPIRVTSLVRLGVF